jgi:hypothetical protein
MGLTIISHFYNEEYLLPWWCKHHKRICDDAILIDYGSTDRSVEVIKEICPEWTIVKTTNKHFDAASVDREVEYYERTVSGWKLALNTTEFLYGNTKQLLNITDPEQKYLGNYVFIDVNGDFILDKNKPLHEQCFTGYKDWMDRTNMLSMCFRSSRSIHNKNIEYPIEGGRHYPNQPSFYDLWIFYYGFCSMGPEMQMRKLQIQNKMSNQEKEKTVNHPNNVDWDELYWRLILFQRDEIRNVREDVEWIASFNY